MAKHLQRDLEHLKREILGVGTLVEESIGDALRALTEQRRDLVDKVIAGDRQIDDLEVKVEDECLKILALHNPMAADLRFVVAVLKVNNDLERMGDLATNIAKRARHDILSGQETSIFDFASMGRRVMKMVHQSLDSLVHLDTEMAEAVCALDQEVDESHRAAYQRMKSCMRQDPGCIDRAVNALTVSRSLERIADLATNIAEDVVFLVEGEVIRHRGGPHADAID